MEELDQSCGNLRMGEQNRVNPILAQWDNSVSEESAIRA
ncbi:Uncharacterised protein [Mycobacteroides abscessus subsp. abscessus]|nr:Uncharacterised protein [Mycobacteroides abscessus subsp. abscessus]